MQEIQKKIDYIQKFDLKKEEKLDFELLLLSHQEVTEKIEVN